MGVCWSPSHLRRRRGLRRDRDKWSSVTAIPQGGPLSPLLRNLVLDELDRELERRGHRFVRYADDCNIYVRSERSGQRVMDSITRFITQRLKLKVNDKKSAVARPQERKFLGFSFTDGPVIRRRIAPKAVERFKERIREITRQAKGVSLETTMAKLAPYMRALAWLFRILRNAGHADPSDSLGSVAPSGCAVAAMENATPPPGNADSIGCAWNPGGQYCRQWPRPLASRPFESSERRAFERVLPFAWS